MNILRKSKLCVCRISRSISRSLSYRIEQLHQRTLIKLSGDDVRAYIQGLVTNDVNRLENNECAIYAHFLNNKGRILYDVFLCKSAQNELLLECDTCIRDDIIKHLKMYRVRKKVNIEQSDENVWSLINDSILSANIENWSFEDDANSKYDRIVSELRNKNILSFQDPRIPSVGLRIYSSMSQNLTNMLDECKISTIESQYYVVLRYKLGIAEGVSEIPVGKCFPLEMNCDYLNGVSFHKGCYIGQELTARTHHTGVVRKRIMPLTLSSVPDQEVNYDSVIVTEDDEVVGKLRGIHGEHCISLLRISESLKNPAKLNLNGIPASTWKPFWWPS